MSYGPGEIEDLKDQAVSMVLGLEWSANFMDTKGDRCPYCSIERSPTERNGNHSCVLGRLARKLREAFR